MLNCSYKYFYIGGVHYASTYAHNKFGKLVIPKLPSTIKETVRKYPNEFRMGLQGPDFLFFYLTRKDIN